MALKLKTTTKKRKKKKKKGERVGWFLIRTLPLASHCELPAFSRSLHSPGRGFPAAANVAHAKDGGGASAGCWRGRDMRSLLASLALALAPRFLTYTGTLAPRPPHALPGWHSLGAQPAEPRAPPRRAPLPPRAPRPPPGRCTLRVLTGAPQPPDAPSQPGNRFHNLRTTHWLLLLLFPSPQRDLLWGWAPPAPRSVLSRRLCCSAALGRKLARGPGLHHPDQGRGELVPLRPPAPCRILAGSLGGPAASLPYSPRCSLSLALFCHWAARGGLGPCCSRALSAANSRESGEHEAGTEEVKGLREGEDRRGGKAQSRAGLTSWDPGGRNWKEVGLGRRPRELETF